MGQPTGNDLLHISIFAEQSLEPDLNIFDLLGTNAMSQAGVWLELGFESISPQKLCRGLGELEFDCRVTRAMREEDW